MATHVMHDTPPMGHEQYRLICVMPVGELGNCIIAVEDKLVYQLSVDEGNRRCNNVLSVSPSSFALTTG